MTTNELPAKYRHLTAPEAAEMLAMARDALSVEGNPHAEQLAEHAAYLERVIALRTRREDQQSDDVTIGRRAGSAAANQFGTFTVHAASDAQVRFLQSLIAEKDTTGITTPATLDGISKKSASALIEKLIDRPRKAGAVDPGRGPRPASEKQVAFARSLASERLDVAALDVYLAAFAKLTSTEASAAIDALKAMPRRPREAAPQVEHKPGAYRVDGRVIRVYLGQQSRKMLAAELVDAAARTRDDAWEYLGLASRFVPADAVRMTVEECEQVAGSGQADHSWCCVCGRALDDPNSVKRGIGPICRAKQGGT